MSSNFMAAVTIAVILEPKKRKSVTISTFSPSICHEVMGQDLFFFFPIFSSKLALSLSSFTCIKGLFSSSSLSAVRKNNISEVVNVSPISLGSSLYLIQRGISHDVLSVQIKQTGLQQTALSYSFFNPEPISCSIQDYNGCFLTCIQDSQETDNMVSYSHLFKSFPQFIMIHTVKGFGIGNEIEVDVFSGIPYLSLWSSECWPFDLWFLFLF